MKKLLWYKLNLQLFSGEGEGGNTGQTGVISADAEQGSTEDSTQEFSRLISGKFKDEFTRKTQAIIDKRFKATKQLEEYKSKVSPVIERLMEKYSLSPGQESDLIDVLFGEGEQADNALSDISTAPVDETAVKKETTETQSNDRFHHQDLLRERAAGWLKQSEALKGKFPNFDLRSEIRENKLFSQLLLGGVDLGTAYETVHQDEAIRHAMRFTADAVRNRVVRNIEAKGRRPIENGISSESAVVTSVDVNSLTSQDILKILKQVESGASITF